MARAGGARLRKPQPVVVLPGEGHRGVEANHRRPASDRENRLNDRFANLGVEIVELGGVVPRHRGAVVAVVDETLVTGGAVDPFEDDRGVALLPIVILDEDADPFVIRYIGSVKRVGGVGRMI